VRREIEGRDGQRRRELQQFEGERLLGPADSAAWNAMAKCCACGEPTTYSSSVTPRSRVQYRTVARSVLA
jgi:hypothetical protein